MICNYYVRSMMRQQPTRAGRVRVSLLLSSACDAAAIHYYMYSGQLGNCADKSTRGNKVTQPIWSVIHSIHQLVLSDLICLVLLGLHPRRNIISLEKDAHARCFEDTATKADVGNPALALDRPRKQESLPSPQPRTHTRS